MRSILAALVTLALATGALFAADTMTQQGGASSDQSMSQGGSSGGASADQAMKEKTITATVKNVKKDSKKITVTGPEGNKAEYTLKDTTVITTQSGEQKTIGDLKNGTKVTITYTGTRDNPNITNVTVQEGK